MGWTDRKEIKTSFVDIIDYLESTNCFHDYRLGNIHYDGKEAFITIEEVIPGKKIQDSTGLIWDFHFKDVTFFKFDVDVVMGFWILEVEKGETDNEISFNLDSGQIRIASDSIEFGIPMPEEKQE